MPLFTDSPLLSSIRGIGKEPPVAVQENLLELLITAIEEYYVHLPLKRSALAVDPVEQLRLLLDSGRGKSRPGFLRRLLRIVNGMKDRHTTLRLPPPWTGLVAYVPFVVEQCQGKAGDLYVVTKQLYGFEDIPVGAVLSHWNGMPIHRQVGRLAAESQGANLGAAKRLGLANLTIRPLEYVLMPDEDWVTLSYRTREGESRTTTTPWRYYMRQFAGAHGSAGSGEGDALGAGDTTDTLLGIDQALHVINESKRQGTKPSGEKAQKFQKDAQTGILFGTVDTDSGSAGYMRIFSFSVPDATKFVESCARILSSLPQDRLIIDVRSNPGGLITAGQKLIRMLTKKSSLTTSSIAFRNTSRTRSLGNIPQFAAWQLSLDLQSATGQNFAQTIPLTTYDDVPDYRYPGRVGLVIDGLCYSTTDFFAADFMDNDVGTIVGIDESTGGGGANVWTWPVLQRFANFAGANLPGMPGGFNLNISMRRSVRTGKLAGIPVEDLGVKCDVLHQLTMDDLFHGNKDLINFTVGLLSKS